VTWAGTHALVHLRRNHYEKWALVGAESDREYARHGSVGVAARAAAAEGCMTTAIDPIAAFMKPPMP
jgi:hypothetical protein